MRIRVLAFRCTLPAAVAMLLAGCAASPPSVYSVQPLYESSANRLSTVALHVDAPSDVITVLPPGFSVNYPATMPAPAGVGVGVGVLGATIAQGIIGAIVSAEDQKKADDLRLRLLVLRDQVASLDYGPMIGQQMEQALGEHARAQPRPWKLVAGKPAGRVDGTLSVQVHETFLNWAIPRRPGVPLLPAGLLLYIRADVTLTAADGATLLKDAVVFETPYSAEPYDEVRIAWWKEHDRFRRLLELSGRALATGIEEQVIGTPRYASEAAFTAQREADERVPATVRENRLDAVLEGFRHCDDFYGASASDTKFESYRNEADGFVYVGIACGRARQAEARRKGTSSAAR